MIWMYMGRPLQYLAMRECNVQKGRVSGNAKRPPLVDLNGTELDHSRPNLDRANIMPGDIIRITDMNVGSGLDVLERSGKNVPEVLEIADAMAALVGILNDQRTKQNRHYKN